MKTSDSAALPLPLVSVSRRRFLTAAATGAAGLVILPSGVLSGQNAPSNKLNVALIGTWGRGEAHFDGLANENVVALCDVNEKHLAFAAKKFPKAKQYVDWRKCLDQKDLDAVVCCTADHTHAFVANWAMNRGLHIYLREAAGQQRRGGPRGARDLPQEQEQAGDAGRHAAPRLRELQPRARTRPGRRDRRAAARLALGQPPASPPGYLPAAGRAAEDAPLRPVDRALALPSLQPRLLLRQSGMNCLQWNMYWDFGSGQVGDMGSHTMDLAWNAIDAGLPTSAGGEGRAVQPRGHAGRAGDALRAPGQRLAAGHPRLLVSGRRDAAPRRASTST